MKSLFILRTIIAFLFIIIGVLLYHFLQQKSYPIEIKPPVEQTISFKEYKDTNYRYFIEYPNIFEAQELRSVFSTSTTNPALYINTTGPGLEDLSFIEIFNWGFSQKDHDDKKNINLEDFAYSVFKNQKDIDKESSSFGEIVARNFEKTSLNGISAYTFDSNFELGTFGEGHGDEIPNGKVEKIYIFENEEKIKFIARYTKDNFEDEAILNSFRFY